MKNLVFALALAVALFGCARKDTVDAATPAAAAPAAAPASTPAAGPVATSGEGAAATPQSARAAASAPADRKTEYRDVIIPAGTVLPLALRSSVASDTSKVEDQVRASTRRAITIDGVQVVPAGTAVLGHVTSVERSGKVKGRASIAFRFNQIDVPAGGHETIRTATVSRIAPATKKKDAAKIGAGAGAGAVIGGIVGGGSGAAKGAAIGGGAGTAVVLSTRGKEVRLGAGTPLAVKLLAPLTVRVPLR